MTIRCAIYTRKSSEEGLAQAFNSLSAQRELCEAYIHSQKAEGWIALPAHYDDGGISGGTLARPALRQLLEDIEQHKVDQIIVYRIDRLTRSLSDFAKLIDRFDAHDVSMVSVSQPFDTGTSVGRLTLNMLLSCRVGGVNGDGYGDLIIGARGADPNRRSSGETCVVYGGASAAGTDGVLALSDLDGTSGFTPADAVRCPVCHA